MPKKIKVMVVDDSSIMRLMVTDILNKDKDINVIDTANNGQEAIDKVFKCNPDVIVMDLNMGQYDGVYAVKHIMSQQPIPIILLSAIGNTDLKPVLHALELGAFDYLNKPAEGNIKLKKISHELVQKVKSAAASNLEVLIPEEVKPLKASHTFSQQLDYEVIVIGASTGGPTAIEKVISQLPENLIVPVVIAQHMPNNFISSFVARLDRLTPLKVRVGEEGMKILPKNIYVAPGNSNMILKPNGEGVEISFTKRRYPDYNHPSVSALMSSAAEIFGQKTIGVVLTGMGRDGKSGIEDIKKAGGLTLAQSENTSVVFGMPREAIESGYVDQVVDLNEIGFFVVSSLN